MIPKWLLVEMQPKVIPTNIDLETILTLQEAIVSLVSPVCGPSIYFLIFSLSPFKPNIANVLLLDIVLVVVF